MNDSVFDVNEIAAVIANAGCLNDRGDEHCFRLRHPECAAAAVVAWLDERVLHVGWYDPVYEGWVVKSSPNEYVYRIVQPEDQK